MNLRSLRLRAVGPPLAVAAICAAALFWFDRIWIPTQQQYLNERNLRALRTISAQIKAKVDNFDQAIDHAIDSFPTQGGNASLQRDLQRYVKLFSPELEIVTFDTNSPAAKVTPGDPPNVTIQRDEGRNYLYLGYLHEKAHRTGLTRIELIARGDVDQATAPLLARTDFDALLLVDAKGATIAQQSSSGLELTSMTKVRDRGLSPAPPNEPGVFDRMRGTTGVAVVTIGAADYMLYTQPVQLSLLHESKKAGSAPEGKKASSASESKKTSSSSDDKGAASAADDKSAASVPEEWTLTGLVRLDRFRAASSTIPTTYWLWFGAVLALVCFAIPVLKPRVLSPRERLTRIDSVSIGAAIFVMMALATFTALDLRTFGSLVPAAVDQQLQSVATSMAKHVGEETEAVGKQMEALADERLWKESLDYEHEHDAHSLDEIRRDLKREEGADINLDAGAQSGAQAGRSQCKPSWSCRSGVLMRLEKPAYPFFKIIGWSDDAGWQRIKWSTSAVVTPFVNIGDSKLSYFESLKLARRLSSPQSDVPKNGVSVITSPNTGEKVTVFWQALPLLDPAKNPKNPANDPVKDPAEPDMTGVTLVTAPVSLTAPVLPKNLQFAVVDRQGRVLFHSDASRSLAENMFQESEDSPKLKSLVTSRETGTFTARYLGREHRFFVRPLDLKPFDTRWSLLVFQASAVTETANLGTLNLAVSMFVVYLMAIAVTWTVLGMFWPDAVKRLLWPLAIRGPQYHRAAKIGTVAGLICMAVIAQGMPFSLLFAATALTVGALISMFVIVRGSPDSARVSPTWSTDFVWARASMLVLLAAVPASLCFHLSYAFHGELVAKRAESQLTSDLNTRARRISQQTKGVALCTESDPGYQACPGVGNLVGKRTRETLWDVDVPLVRKAEAELAGHAGSVPGAVQSFLSLAYRPYNDIAADLLMTAPARPNQALEDWHPTVSADGKEERFAERAAVTGWQFKPAITPTLPINTVAWLLSGALMGVAYLLVRYLLRPIFALELGPAPTLLGASGAAEDTSLLVLGPPGSRRTGRLLRHPRVRIFDVRSLSFAEDPTKGTAADEPISSAADCEPGDRSSSGWADEIHEATSRPFTIVALDYLEHRLDDPAFRATMLDRLESAVYRDRATIWCSSVRDPIELLEELEPPAPDRRRWARVFEQFRREHLGFEVDRPRSIALAKQLDRCATGLAPDVRQLILSECEIAQELLAIAENLAHRLPPGTALSAEDILEEIGSGARYFYEGLWNGCSTSERVVLRQLAEEGLVNPNNQAAISRMLNAGLVRHGQTFRIMNETFRRFVLCAASHEVVSSWEREGVSVPWGTIATTGVTVAFGLAGLLLLTQEQLVDAWISYVPALAPAIPTVWKVLAGVQKGRIEITA